MKQPLADALNQLAVICDAVREEISVLDDKIATLKTKRQTLTSGTVSKKDFLELLRADLSRRGQPCAIALQKEIREYRKDYEFVHQIDITGNLFLRGLLSRATLPVVITEEAVFFYFGEMIVDRIGALIEKEPWPQSAATYAELLKLIPALDAEIKSLSEEREGLVSQLNSAGASA